MKYEGDNLIRPWPCVMTTEHLQWRRQSPACRCRVSLSKNARPQMTFVVVKVTLAQLPIRVLQFALITLIIPPVFLTCISIEFFRLVRYYASWDGLKPMFREYLSVPCSRFKTSCRMITLKTKEFNSSAAEACSFAFHLNQISPTVQQLSYSELR